MARSPIIAHPHVKERNWTWSTRKELEKAWVSTPAVYDEHTLQIDQQPVMEDWEKSYMAKLAQVACSGSTDGSDPPQVLEIGFGLGISARAVIQNLKPLSGTHNVVECHPQVIERCRRDFAEELAAGQFRILEGFWQDVVPQLADASFDGILYDPYPLVQEDQELHPYSFFTEAYRLLKPGGVLTYYSDEVTDFGSEHLSALRAAGFEDIHSELCQVNPPENCRYWHDKTFLVPIVRKTK